MYRLQENTKQERHTKKIEEFPFECWFAQLLFRDHATLNQTLGAEANNGSQDLEPQAGFQGWARTLGRHPLWHYLTTSVHSPACGHIPKSNSGYTCFTRNSNSQLAQCNNKSVKLTLRDKKRTHKHYRASFTLTIGCPSFSHCPLLPPT